MTAPADRATALDALLLQVEVERFFSAESELLDERRFDEWLDLLHEDIRYWMPIARNMRFDRPETEYTRQGDEACWFDEGKDVLRKRVLQIQGGDHWAEEPRSRTTHLVANVRVEAAEGGDIAAKSRFVVSACRLDHDVDLFVGKRVDLLRREHGALKVLRRTIYLDQSVLLSRNLTTFF
ncbi:MAG TPA: 3-phenylpropionate/cinnamic acid dioxygenase subunit beta [Stellaceae bacterium]|nr:3-phenylpropionate/cinnamic acid dioxygenase subunit beta [Stellaceae bacterium]